MDETPMTTRTPVTRSDVVDVLHVIQAEDANRKNQAECLYTYPDGKHCIAGEVLARLGANLPDTDERHDNGHGFVQALNQATISYLRDIGFDFGINLDVEAYRLLGSVQFAADGGTKWAEIPVA